jgi:hypothetical protein
MIRMSNIGVKEQLRFLCNTIVWITISGNLRICSFLAEATFLDPKPDPAAVPPPPPAVPPPPPAVPPPALRANMRASWKVATSS